MIFVLHSRRIFVEEKSEDSLGKLGKVRGQRGRCRISKTTAGTDNQ